MNELLLSILRAAAVHTGYTLVCVAVGFVLGLFLGFRYRFSGPDLDRDNLNGMIGNLADTASDLGHKVMEELKHDWHSDEK